jgi:hypothetical protein
MLKDLRCSHSYVVYLYRRQAQAARVSFSSSNSFGSRDEKLVCIDAPDGANGRQLHLIEISGVV